MTGGRYYEFFDLPLALRLDAAALQKRFYELSRQWHPDRFVARPPADRQLALDNTALLNDAFRALRDPVLRAEYFLEQNGLAASGQGSGNVPMDLLEEALELNMALEEVDPADPNSLSELNRFHDQFGALLADVDRTLDAQFAKFDSEAEARAETLTAIRQTLNRRKYISNLTSKIEKALQAVPAAS